MKKAMFLTAAFVCLLICTSAFSGQQSDESKPLLDSFLIKNETPIDNCEQRGLAGKILFFGSKNCPYCVRVKPIIESIIKEEGLEAYYEEFDLAEPAALRKFRTCHCELDLAFVPILIVNCQVVPGEKSQDEYRAVLQKFKALL